MSQRIIHTTDFAGHCNELTAWRILTDITKELLQTDNSLVVLPSDIMVCDNGSFCLDRQNGKTLKPANDEKSAVWHLAASLYYLMMGRELAFGTEQTPQTATSRIPYLRSSMPELSTLISQCLAFNPSERPSMEDLYAKAVANHERVKKIFDGDPPAKAFNKSSSTKTETKDSFWPEKMCAIQ